MSCHVTSRHARYSYSYHASADVVWSRTGPPGALLRPAHTVEAGLLRLREAAAEDTGRYRCEVSCCSLVTASVMLPLCRWWTWTGMSSSSRRLTSWSKVKVRCRPQVQ